MVRFFQWLIGYVIFEFRGGFADGFINDCFLQNINIQNLLVNDGTLSAQCSASEYLKLHSIAQRNGGILSVKKKHGPLFPFLKIRHRWGLFVGALAFVLLLNILMGLVWEINITGIDRIPVTDIQRILDDNGLHRGSYIRGIDCDTIENTIMYKLDDCAWAHINIKGTTVNVEIDETISKPSLLDNKTVANVKASKDGTIYKLIAYDGWQMVNEGEGVVKGDLLISGINNWDEGKTNHFAHARGKVLARVDDDMEISVSRVQCRKEYTNTKIYKSIYFFGMNIPLYIGKSDTTFADVELDGDYISVNSKNLPVGIITRCVKYYTVDTVELSDKDLNALATDEIAKQIIREHGQCEIIKKKVDVILNPDDAIARASVTCIEDIGEEIVVNIDEKSKKNGFIN